MHHEVLDHGYVTLVEHWGSDERIIEAARMSTGGGFKRWGDPAANPPTRGDERLLRYLYENKHATPFEMAGVVLEVKAPIFVFRQWHRHRTQSYNEMSARYTPLPNEDYVPTPDRLVQASSKNKQAGKVKGALELDLDNAHDIGCMMREHNRRTQALYQTLLAEGAPKELARLVLPVSRYSCMRASANLRNWLAFMTLRCDPHAQYEIRVYAEAIAKIIDQLFPRTYELWVEGVERAANDRLMREFVSSLYTAVFEDWKEQKK